MATIEWYESIAGRQRIPPALIGQYATDCCGVNAPRIRPHAAGVSFKYSLIRARVVLTLQRMRDPLSSTFQILAKYPDQICLQSLGRSGHALFAHGIRSRRHIRTAKAYGIC